MKPEKTTTDIIGIVRELQGLRPVSKEVPQISKYTGEKYFTPLEKGDCRTEDYATHVYKQLPTIAEALLIAVEALEKEYERDGCPKCSYPNHRVIHSFVCQALSRIRSLTPKQHDE